MQRNQLVLKSLFFINQNSTVLSSDIKTKHYIVISIWLHSPCLYRRLFIVERMASKLFGQRQSFSLCYNSYLIDVYDPSSKMFYSQTCVHFLLLFHIVSLLNFIISSINVRTQLLFYLSTRMHKRSRTYCRFHDRALSSMQSSTYTCTCI